MGKNKRDKSEKLNSISNRISSSISKNCATSNSIIDDSVTDCNCKDKKCK